MQDFEFYEGTCLSYPNNYVISPYAGQQEIKGQVNGVLFAAL